MIGDVEKLAKVLCRARRKIKKSSATATRELSVRKRVLDSWESGMVFPPEDILKSVSEVYEIKLEELTTAWKLSKQARVQELEARRPERHVKKPLSRDWDVFIPNPKDRGRRRHTRAPSS